MKKAITILLLLAPSLLTAAAIGSFSAEYELKRNSITIGRSVLSLQLNERDNYHMQIDTKPVGMIAFIRSDVITEKSQGQLIKGGPRPSSYRYQHKKGDKDKDLRLTFNWRTRNVEHREKQKKTQQLKVPSATQDKLSQLLKLILSVPDQNKSISIAVVDGGKTLSYSYQNSGIEQQKTPAGDFSSYKMVRSKSGQPSKVTLWLGTKINHIPVRIDRKKGGALYSMRLTKLTRGTEGIKGTTKPPQRGKNPFTAWAE